MIRTIVTTIETAIVQDTELISVHGIKQYASVGSAAVCNWQTRYDDFPTPVIDLPDARLWRFEEIDTWLRARNKISHNAPNPQEGKQ